MEYSQIVLQYMDNMGVSAYKLSKILDISESTFSKWRSKPTSKLDTSILVKISKYFNVSLDALLAMETTNTINFTILTENQQDLLKAFDQLTDKNQDRAIGAVENILFNQREAEQTKENVG